MISNAKEGGTITNFSDRFTITGMTGSVTAQVRSAVSALGGSAQGPPAINALAADAPAAVPAAGAFGIPYNQQEGATRYAPMQGVPPTKITKKDMRPLFPTSAYTVAKTWLPKPSIVTTLTDLQTFSVQSHENTVCLHVSAMCSLEANIQAGCSAIKTDR